MYGKMATEWASALLRALNALVKTHGVRLKEELKQ